MRTYVSINYINITMRLGSLNSGWSYSDTKRSSNKDLHCMVYQHLEKTLLTLTRVVSKLSDELVQTLYHVFELDQWNTVFIFKKLLAY